MSSGQKMGVVLILVGLALLVVPFPFAEIYPAVDDSRFPPTMVQRIRRGRILLVEGKGTEESVCREERMDEINRWLLEIAIEKRREVGRR